MNERTTIIIIIALLTIGTFYLHFSEDWSYVDSFYFSTITLTTIGYGDLYPSKDSTKIFISLYAMFGIGIMLYALGSIIGKRVVERGTNLHKVFAGIYDLKYNLKDRTRRKLNREIGKNLIKRATRKEMEKKLIEKW